MHKIGRYATGSFPRFRSDDGPALKARFNAPVRRQSHTDCYRNESRFQRWRFGVARIRGALPQAAYERRAFGAKQIPVLAGAGWPSRLPSAPDRTRAVGALDDALISNCRFRGLRSNGSSSPGNSREGDFSEDRRDQQVVRYHDSARGGSFPS
jgi:hypothetical protein